MGKMHILNVTSRYIQGVAVFFKNHKKKSLWRNAHILNVVSGYIQSVTVFFKNHNKLLGKIHISWMSYRIMYRKSPFSLRITTNREKCTHL